MSRRWTRAELASLARRCVLHVVLGSALALLSAAAIVATRADVATLRLGIAGIVIGGGAALLARKKRRQVLDAITRAGD